MPKLSSLLSQPNIKLITKVTKVKPVISKAIPLHLKADSTKISLRHFNAASINDYTKDPAFNYAIKKQHLSLWDRFWLAVWNIWTSFWEWVISLFEKLFGHAAGGNISSVLKYIVLIGGIVLLVYIIAKLLGVSVFRLFKKEPALVPLPYNESIENIHEISFDEAIENALAAKDYRLAVRLLYLRSLKQLSDNNLINWRIEKTNSAYINELTDPQKRQQFILVTRQFEYIWYGNFPVDGRLFQKIDTIFKEFKQLLS